MRLDPRLPQEEPEDGGGQLTSPGVLGDQRALSAKKQGHEQKLF
jgi:hypothetical protein